MFNSYFLIYFLAFPALVFFFFLSDDALRLHAFWRYFCRVLFCFLVLVVVVVVVVVVDDVDDDDEDDDDDDEGDDDGGEGGEKSGGGE